MAQGVTEDGPTKSVEFMKLLLESQQQQSEQLTVALEKMVASGSQAIQGNVPDFRRLNPAVFTGEESHLDTEQWLIDMETYW